MTTIHLSRIFGLITDSRRNRTLKWGGIWVLALVSQALRAPRVEGCGVSLLCVSRCSPTYLIEETRKSEPFAGGSLVLQSARGPGESLRRRIAIMCQNMAKGIEDSRISDLYCLIVRDDSLTLCPVSFRPDNAAPRSPGVSNSIAYRSAIAFGDDLDFIFSLLVRLEMFIRGPTMIGSAPRPIVYQDVLFSFRARSAIRCGFVRGLSAGYLGRAASF